MNLTPREMEVARLFALGGTYESIAIDLGLSRSTIRHLRGSAMDKCDAGSMHGVWMALGWLRVPGAAEAEAHRLASALIAAVDQLRASESDADVPAGSWARDDPAPSIRSVA